ncbi:DegT/DnrJ/EryC1/StrS family aminotransferase [Carboxydochorda subterranea]|uniref:DegT/DnrJ/EryC1/StrS family aminotransferase n=1 Tax=Carboxydichorda subterranea TaxID=3109565 RepID=A0ABZ1C084_9FIRM|nr:DegT/DnrJ/EryC1/StrS family aminotransferase [Limnochorda sp. L945t]WRP18437.1 DegT/DnrJ/EryC1/StrS family aminotransferase [Limnochorda sp. L945t]
MNALTHPIPAFDLTRQHARLLPELVEAAREVLASGHMILGANVAALEQEVARLCGVEHGVGVASGTDGLYLALRALGIGPGDEVVTTPFTFLATATSIVRAGATPVFADIEPDTLNTSARRIAEALTPRTRAIVVVHLYGNPVAMEPVMELARARSLKVVEDMAQAIGASYQGRPVGSFADAAVISFYPTKNLGGCGDGGMVVTRDGEVAERLRILRDHGQRHRYVSEDVAGINSRLDELQAALLRVKLRYLDAFTERRRVLARRYREGLAGLDVVPLAETPGGRSVYHQFTVRSARRDRLQAYLKEHGVGSTVYYPVPLHRQAVLQERVAHPRPLPEADRAAQEVLSLPMFPELEVEEVERVCALVREFAVGSA